MSDDPICDVCGEPKSAHVATDDGPLSHPREARGEGRYELVRAGYMRAGSWPGDDDVEVKPLYRFVENAGRCVHPCGCGPDPCPHHGPRCRNGQLKVGPFCGEHGCQLCGAAILADYEEARLCVDCAEAGDMRGSDAWDTSCDIVRVPVTGIDPAKDVELTVLKARATVPNTQQLPRSEQVVERARQLARQAGAPGELRVEQLKPIVVERTTGWDVMLSYELEGERKYMTVEVPVEEQDG